MHQQAWTVGRGVWRCAVAVVGLLALGCSAGCGDEAGGGGGGGGGGAATTMTKWALWSGGAELRGANIWIGRADDPIYEGVLGPGPYGPSFSQQDFEALAASGANLVNISHPGLYSVAEPFALDTDAQASLDELLSEIAAADLFAVITMRTGPGRSEWTFHWGNDTTTDPVKNCQIRKLD